MWDGPTRYRSATSLAHRALYVSADTDPRTYVALFAERATDRAERSPQPSDRFPLDCTFDAIGIFTAHETRRGGFEQGALSAVVLSAGL